MKERLKNRRDRERERGREKVYKKRDRKEGTKGLKTNSRIEKERKETGMKEKQIKGTESAVRNSYINTMHCANLRDANVELCR